VPDSVNESRLWNRDFLILALVNFFIALNFYLLMVIISLFAMESLHSSPGQAGLASGIFVIGAVIARLFAGKWIERIGRKNMLCLGLILSLVMSLAYFGIGSIIFLLIVRFLHGAGFGIASIAAMTIIAGIVPKERFGEGLGYFTLSVTLASAIGPFLSMLISQRSGFVMIFVVCAVSAALNLATALFLSVAEIQLTPEQLERAKGFNFESFFELKAIAISIVCGIIYLCYSSVLSFLTPYAKEIHLAGPASLFFIFLALAVSVSRPSAGRLLDSKGDNWTMYPAILIFVIGVATLSQAHYGYALLAAGALIGVGFGSVQSSGQAISLKVTPPHRAGLAASTFFIFIDVGTGIGSCMFGLLIPHTGYRGMYVVAAILAFACIFLYYALHGKRTVAGRVVENAPAN
jgi:MFS family permease